MKHLRESFFRTIDLRLMTAKPNCAMLSQVAQPMPGFQMEFLRRSGFKVQKQKNAALLWVDPTSTVITSVLATRLQFQEIGRISVSPLTTDS